MEEKLSDVTNKRNNACRKQKNLQNLGNLENLEMLTNLTMLKNSILQFLPLYTHRLKIYIGNTLLIALSLIAIYVLEIIGFIDLRCQAYKYLNVACPTCGITRLFGSLIHLDFYQAFRWNPLIFISIPLFILGYIRCGYDYVRTGSVHKNIGYVVLAYGVLLLIFAVLRNTEMFNWLYPTRV